ncbi:uncharacterized protein LOC132730414 [Ruditapes philippinarum]|uniref:uncharacterized protein LOC132730414 n=1 Tax=Ruditapes philippinarum TaxID=129788 RepID=UPI00295AD8FE|nr:uncharacterized protein LOC132730414 [Ruditapes philippinarum]
MFTKTVNKLYKKLNSTFSDTLHGITQQHAAATVDVTNQTPRFSLDNRRTSTFTTQSGFDPYLLHPTSLTTSRNITHSTMTRNIVSAFTVNGGEAFDKPHHTTMVAVLLGIFTIISITMAVSVLVFCRKKNSVFMLQKCDQDSDIDLEMNDMNTEVETSDSEYEFIESTSPQHATRRSQTCPNLSTYNADKEGSCQPKNSEKYNRCSLNKSRNQLKGSPTLTPLLISSSAHNDKTESQLSQSFSSKCTNNKGAATLKISGAMCNRNRKDKYERSSSKDIKDESERDTFLIRDGSNKPKKLKMKKHSTIRQQNSKRNKILEHKTLDINETNSDYNSKRTIRDQPFCERRKEVSNNECYQLNTSILKMESVEDDDIVYVSDGEVHLLDNLNGKLEIL